LPASKIPLLQGSATLTPQKRLVLTPLNPGYLAGEEIKCGRHVATLLLISPALTDRQAQDDKDDKDDV